MLKKLSFRLSFLLIIILGSIVTVFTIYLINDRSDQLKQMMLQKGIAAAKTGAKIMSETLDNIVENKIYTKEELFNDPFLYLILFQIYTRVFQKKILPIFKNITIKQALTYYWIH